MTPKEKAQKIFDKYFDEMLSFGFYLHNSQIIRLSLIAVDEIIEHCNYANKWYWQEVKQEIEAL